MKKLIVRKNRTILIIKKGMFKMQRTHVKFYRSWVEPFYLFKTFKDQYTYISILFELLFMDIDKIEEFNKRTEEIMAKYRATDKVKLALINIIPNIRKNIKQFLERQKTKKREKSCS